MNESEYNRNESYMDLVNNKQLGETQEAVFRTIFSYPDSTDQEISLRSNIPLNVVNARRNELFNEGLVKSSGSKIGSSGKPNTTWRVNLDSKVPKEMEGSYLTSREMATLERLLYKLKSNDHKFQIDKIKRMLD